MFKHIATSSPSSSAQTETLANRSFDRPSPPQTREERNRLSSRLGLRYGRVMAKAYTTWKVLPHRPIEKLSENLWRVEGDLAGMQLKRVMSVVKRSDGQLLIHNAIALDDGEMAELEAFGPIGYILVPNGFHRLDAGIYKARYPKARVLCPRGARAKVAQVVAVDGTYEDLQPDDAVTLTTLEGVGAQEGVLLVRSADGATVIFNDALFNMPHGKGLTGFIFKHLTQSSGGLRATRIAKLLLIKDKAAFREHLQRLADTPRLRRIIVAHHELYTGDAPAALRAVAATLQ